MLPMALARQEFVRIGMANGRDFYVTATANYIPSFFGLVSHRASPPL